MRRALIERKLGRVDRAIDKAIDGAEMPGAVVLARMPRDGEVLTHESVRGVAVSRPERIPMARDTVFDLASLTKVMATTTAVMLLAERGALDVDDPVARHLPAFGERDKDAVTLRHLLTHSSGLRPWRGYHETLLERDRKKGEAWIGTPRAKEWVVDSICRSALVHEPGSAAVYGDLDFITLGAVVEAVSGEPLDAFCRANVFEPLGMKDTFFVPLGESGAPEALKRRMAATENCPWRERILWGEVHDPNASAMGGVAGHAGLFASADDVLRFGQAMLDAWHGRSDLLPGERVREFATRQGPAARLRLGARLGHAGGERLVGGRVLLSRVDRAPGLHGHLALDRPGGRGHRGDAHQPRPPGGEEEQVHAAGRGARPHPRSLRRLASCTSTSSPSRARGWAPWPGS